MEDHKDTIAVASVAPDHGAEVTYLGTIGTRQDDIDTLLRKMPSTAQPLSVLYEAGPCGSWLYRSLQKQGDDGGVVAPSLIPKNAGERGKTDRRDAVQLARLARSGALTPVDVPQVDADASRDLPRARDQGISARQDANFRLTACWRRQDIRYAGRAHGGPAHLRWLAEGGCPTPAQPIVFQASVRTVTEHTERRGRLEHERREPVTTWRLPPVLEALQARRGVQLTGAGTLVAASGDLPRFEHPRALMTCLG